MGPAGLLEAVRKPLGRHLGGEDALETALSTLKKDHLDDIDAELRHLRPSWIERHRQPLLKPMRPGDAANAVGIVREVLRQYARSGRLPPWER